MELNRYWTPKSTKTALKNAAVSAALLSAASLPALANGDLSTGDAAPSSNGVYVTILTPNPGTSLVGIKQVEITAYYESVYGVSTLDLYIDGAKLATQRLTSPEHRGEISFMVDAKKLQSGEHNIVIRATATDAEVSSARTTLTMPNLPETGFKSDTPSDNNTTNDNNTLSSDQSGAPSVQVVSPAPDSTVQGIVHVKVNATDPSGKAPYVSLFVDDAFKTLRNFAPYSFDWDTTRLTNGYHTLKIWAYNEAQQVAHADPIRVLVNNPAGHTFERHDLSDTVPGLPQSPRKTIDRTDMRKILNNPFKMMIVPKKATKPLQIKRRSLNEPIVIRGNSYVLASLLTRDSKLAQIDSDIVDRIDSPSDQLVEPKLYDSLTEATNTQPQMAFKSRPILSNEPNPVFSSHIPTKMQSLESDPEHDILTYDCLTENQSEFVAPKIAEAPLSHVTATMTVIKPKTSPILSHTLNHPSNITSDSSLIKMSSANLDQGQITSGGIRFSVPNIESLKASAKQAMPEIIKHTVNVENISAVSRHHLNGAFDVVFDNHRIKLDRPLQVHGEVLFAPLRQIFQSQGGQLLWDNENQRVTAISDTKEIVLHIGSRVVTINDQAVKLASAPYLNQNRTMLPVDFFPAAMNVKINYDALTGHLIISSK